MRHSSKGITLIEVLLAVFVVSFCLLGVMKLMMTSQRSLTASLGSLQAQASAEELLQQLRWMKWDANSPATGKMPLTGGSPPRVDCPSTCPAITSRTAIEHWSQHQDSDLSRPPYGPFKRRVRVRFVDLDVNNRFFVSTVPTDRKEVTVWSVGKTSSATVTSVFYNLP